MDGMLNHMRPVRVFVWNLRQMTARWFLIARYIYMVLFHGISFAVQDAVLSVSGLFGEERGCEFDPGKGPFWVDSLRIP